MRARRISCALALALCAAQALAQGANVRPVFAVTETRNEAAAYAITHALVVANLVRNCARFRDRIKEDPQAALDAWRQRNGERVEAAQGYVLYARAALERLDGKDAGEAYYRRTTGVFERQAIATLRDIFGAAGPQPEVCARWVGAIAARQADLEWEPRYYTVLNEIVAFHRALTSGAGSR
jgi:hypothetical protein